MENKVSVIIITDNDLEGAGLTLKSLNSFGGEMVDEVYIYNYSSEDSDSAVQPFVGEYTYIKNSDADFSGFPVVINSLVKKLKPNNNILILCKSLMVTPGYVSKLNVALSTYEKAAMAVGYTNGFPGNQALPHEITEYRAATDFSMNEEDFIHRITLGDHRAVLIKRDVFDALGGLNERIKSLADSVTDFYFKVNMKKLNIVEPSGAVVWNVTPDKNEPLIDQEFLAEDYEVLKDEWGIGYYNHGGNRGIIKLISQETNEPIKVLEIGCSKGDTLLEIKEKYPNSEVYGVELDDVAAKMAENFCDVICANVENEDLPYKEEEFDYIILADVLEHLHDPQKALMYLRRFIKPDGAILASIPNVQHISVISELLKGNFTYTPVGLLDHTHIHLFTLNEIIRMFAACNFKMEGVGFTLIHVSDEEKELITKLMDTVETSERFMFEAFQYVFKAEKA